MLKKLSLLLIAFVVVSTQAMAFTIINQTDHKKNIKFEEARRPKDGAMPIAIGNKPHFVEIPARSVKTIELHNQCPVLLFYVTTTTKKKDKTVTSTSTTCYEPYDYSDKKEYFITNDWGLVIHNPLERKGPYDLEKEFTRNQALRNGYGMKLLHPQLLSQTTVEQLAPELQ